MSFRSKMEESERKSRSRIVLALDLVSDRSEDLYTRSTKILQEVRPFICALKINHHLLLPLGLFDGVKRLLENVHRFDLPVIMDCKINDIGSTNRVIAENYFRAGFDAVTANPLVGWKEGLQPVFEAANQMNKGVILLVYMSHKGSSEGYGQRTCDENTGRPKPLYVAFSEKALSWNADGAVVGATSPDKIEEVHTILKDNVPIYSPGVGVQGGDLETAVTSGAHYLIVGRSITYADNPRESAKSIRDSVFRLLKKTRSS